MIADFILWLFIFVAAVALYATMIKVVISAVKGRDQ
jgi:hypothetical protein